MRRALPVAAVLACLLAATLAYFLRDGDEVDGGALVAARAEAVAFFSLDHRHAGEDVDRVIAGATGRFKREYAAKKPEVVAGIEAKRLVVSAVVPDDGVAVESFEQDRARVLVAVDVESRTAKKAATSASYRTRLDLVRVGEAWLVSGLEQVLSGDGDFKVGALPDAAPVRAAVAAVAPALSYDFKSLDASVDAATKRMTPGFAKEFRSTFDATVRSTATQKQAVTTAVVRSAGLVRKDGDTAVCLVYVDQVLDGRISQSRVLVELENDDGWKLANLRPF